MDSESLEFLNLWRKGEEPIRLRAFQEAETLKDIQTDTKPVFEILQDLTSSRIVDESWPRRTPQS